MTKCLLNTLIKGMAVILLMASVGCSTKTIELTQPETESLPSSGILTIYTPDLNLHRVEPRPTTLFLTYSEPNVRKTKLYVLIDIKNIKSKDILKVKIPAYDGLKITSIDCHYMYKENGTITGTYEVMLIPVYNDDTLYMDKVRDSKIKTFKNNDIIEYKYSLGIKLQPNLKLNDLNSYLNHNLVFGSGL